MNTKEEIMSLFGFREKPLEQRQLKEVLPILAQKGSELASEDERKIWDYFKGQLGKIIKQGEGSFPLLVVSKTTGLFLAKRPFSVSVDKEVPPSILLNFLEILGVSWTVQERSLFERPLPFEKSEALSDIKEEGFVPVERIKGLRLQFFTAKVNGEERVIAAELSF